MRVLLDTHALIWFLAGDRRLPVRAREAIEASGAAVLATGFEAVIKAQGFAGLPISLAHAELPGRLDIAHKDPFDRLLVAQARLESIPMISNEVIFDQTGVARVW